MAQPTHIVSKIFVPTWMVEHADQMFRLVNGWRIVDSGEVTNAAGIPCRVFTIWVPLDEEARKELKGHMGYFLNNEL